MEDKPLNKTSDVDSAPVYILQAEGTSDEIFLFDAIKAVARRKFVVLSVLFLSILASIAYISVAVPVFRADVQISAPRHVEIHELLVNPVTTQDLNMKHFTTDKVFKMFLHNLESQEVRRAYFESSILGRGEEVRENDLSYGVFDDHLRIYAKKKKPSFAKVTLDYHDPQLAVQWLGSYLEFVDRYTSNEIVTEVDSAIRSKIKTIEAMISSKLRIADQKRDDSLTRLREALYIATQLGIENPQGYPHSEAYVGANGSPSGSGGPLYMLGTKALAMEISVIEARESQEPYVEGLRQLQEQLSYYRSISIDPAVLSTVSLDGEVKTSGHPVKPDKRFVLMVGMIFGVVAAILAAVMINALVVVRNGQDRAQ